MPFRLTTCFIALFLAVLFVKSTFAQSINLSSNIIKDGIQKVNVKVSTISNQLNEKSHIFFSKLFSEEKRLYKIALRRDSTFAKKLQEGLPDLAQFDSVLKTNSWEYNPQIDSIKQVLSFLNLQREGSIPLEQYNISINSINSIQETFRKPSIFKKYCIKDNNTFLKNFKNLV